jgi:1-acyl-sn-glycerol-3-phosphate acyltransferase
VATEDQGSASAGAAKEYEPFEPDYIRDVVEGPFGVVLDHYFRPRLLGAQRMPTGGPAILASNHSGTAYPWDAMALDGLLWRRWAYEPEMLCRPVFEKELSMAWWMRPFGIDNFWRRGGGVDMTFDNFHRLLARGERVLYYPEGVPGIGKGFGRRYQLQRFSSSFVVQAARHRAPVVPIYTVNAEWVIPFNYTFRWLDRLVQKFHVPFFPLPAGPLTLLFPWMWYLSLPARMIFIVGQPIDVRAKLEELGASSIDDPWRDDARQVAEQIRQLMQAELDRLVARYGRRPYDLRSLARAWGRALRRGCFHRSMPWGWSWSFLRHDRDRRRPPARGRLHRWLRDWDILFYYVPLGWFLLALARRCRRPPCGYRGLSADERREREGNFLWRLDQRPLPPKG